MSLRAHVERAAEDVREAEHVVDLVRVVAAPGGDDRVGPRRLRVRVADLRIGVGQREDDRLLRHRLQHLGRARARPSTGRGTRRRRAWRRPACARRRPCARTAPCRGSCPRSRPVVDDAQRVDQRDVLQPARPAPRRSSRTRWPTRPRPTRRPSGRRASCPHSSAPLSSAAPEMIAVPCWSSWKTGIFMRARRPASISKHSGALMSSRLMPPNVGSSAATDVDEASASRSRRPRGRRRRCRRTS